MTWTTLMKFLKVINGTQKPKIKTIKKETFSNGNEITKRASFIIPATGNLITQEDVSKNQIRITVDFKEYFPLRSLEIDIEYLNEIYRVKFNYRFNKSHILKLGSILANRIKLKAGMTVKMTTMGKYKFRIE